MGCLTTAYLLFLATIFVTSQLSLSRTIIEIKFTNYSDSCTEDASTSKCDPKFKFCLDRPRQSPTFSSCYYAATSESRHFQNTNFIDFRFMSNIKGIPNPWIITTTKIMDPSILLAFQVRDDDLFGDDDHLQTWGIILTENVYPSQYDAVWTSKRSSSNSHVISFEFRIYCEAGVYSSSCSNYCKLTDNPSGHYTCDQVTGAKICMQGWTGASCDKDIDECLWNYCENGICENLQADYTCHCPPYHTGKNCTFMESACEMGPCSNNATCTSMPDFTYSCACIGEWEGENCSIKLNPCKIELCQNGAKCIPSADHTNYSCDCVIPYTGIHCDIINPDLTPSSDVAVTTVSVIKLSTSKKQLTASSLENMAGIAAERTKTREDSVTDNAGIQNWHGILIAVLIIATITVIIICLVVRQRRRKQKLSTDSGVVYNNNNKLAFENNLYNDVTRDPLEGNERHREHPPLPSTPVENDQFMSIKPVFTPSNMDVQGAEGGGYKEFSIDMDADGYVKPSSSKNIKYTKNEDLQRSEQAEHNHYTDFSRLTNKPDSAEDCHFYHDLDEIALAVRGLNSAAKEKEFASFTIAVPKVGKNCGQGKNYVYPGTGEETAYSDTPSNIPVAVNYNRNMQKTFKDDVLDDSFVFVATAPENFYSEPAKPKESSQPELVENHLVLGSGLNEDVKFDMPATNDPFANEMSSEGDEMSSEGEEIQDDGLPQAFMSQDGGYCTPRDLQADSTAPKETPECQYDTPPNNHSSSILTGNYKGAPRSAITKSPSSMPKPLARSSKKPNKNGNENLKSNKYNKVDELSTLPPDVPTRPFANHPEINSRTGSDVENLVLPISIVEGCTFESNDEKSNSEEGDISIKEGSQSDVSQNIFLDNYGSSKT